MRWRQSGVKRIAVTTSGGAGREMGNPTCSGRGKNPKSGARGQHKVEGKWGGRGNPKMWGTTRPECPKTRATQSPERPSMMEMDLSEPLVATKLPEGSQCTWGDVGSEGHGRRESHSRRVGRDLQDHGTVGSYSGWGGTEGTFWGRDGFSPAFTFSRAPRLAAGPL